MKPIGRHALVEFWGVSVEILNDADKLQKMFEEGLRNSGANVIKILFHKFTPQGVTGIALIAESHVSIHTWPEHNYAAVDVFSCGESMDFNVLLSHFESVLKPNKVDKQEFARGDWAKAYRIEKKAR